MDLQKQMPVNETELIKKCQQNDNSAFTELYNMYLSKVYNIVFYMIGDEDAAIEVTQQVFIKIYTAIKDFGFQSSINTWIYRIATNFSLNYIKKMKRNKLMSLEKVNELSSFIIDKSQEEVHLKIQTSELVQKAITKLKPKLRSVVLLRYMNDLSYAEIAQVLGCSKGTVSSRMNSANTILKKDLQFLME